MPVFNVILRGKGIHCALEGHPASMTGFYATRRVRARDAQQACTRACDAVLAQWRDGGQYAAINRGRVPMLAIAEVHPVGWWTAWFTRRPTGYRFHAKDDDRPDTPAPQAPGDDILARLAFVLAEHGLDVVGHQDMLAVDDGRLLLEARVIDHDITGGQVAVVLEVHAYSDLTGERPVVESFAGWGDTREAAVAEAFKKFLMGSLHVLIESLAGHVCDHHPQADIERWAGTDRAWRVWSGPLVVHHGGQSLLVPGYASFLAQLTALFERHVPPGPHWVRVFLGSFHGRVHTIEVLLDNEPWQAGLALAQAHPWESAQEYQSVRHFFLALPESDPPAVAIVEPT